MIIVNYLIHGLDYAEIGGKPTTKTRLKDAWPNAITNHGQGSDEALVLPVSVRAAKSILRLSNALDYIAKEKGASEQEIQDAYFDSVLQAFKFVGAYSGILNEIAVREKYGNDKYSSMDAIIQTTRTQFDSQIGNISSGLYMANTGKKLKKVLDNFSGRWSFMRDFLGGIIEQNSNEIKSKGNNK